MNRHLLFILSMSLLVLLAACGRGGPRGDYLAVAFEVPANTVALEADISYDPEQLELLGAASAHKGVLAAAGTDRGQLKLNAVATDLTPKGRDFALVSFKIKQPGAKPEVKLLRAYNAQKEELDTPRSSMRRTERDLAADYDPEAQAQRTLNPQADSSDLDLQASFADYPLGDLDQSSAVNVFDVIDVIAVSLGSASSATDYQLYVGDLTANGAVDLFDVISVVEKSVNVNAPASLVVRPDVLELATGESGLILVGNAGNLPLNATLSSSTDAAISKLNNEVAGQTAAYEVVAGSKSGPIVVEGAGKKSVGLLVDGDTSGPTPGTVLYRVNANGSIPLSAADGSSPDWEPDASYVTDIGSTSTNTNGSNTTDLGPAPAAIFNSERWDAAAAPEMTYAFPDIPMSEIEVKLYLSETFSGASSVGARIFDVAVEGTVPTVFDNIDQYDLAGEQLNTPVVLSYTTFVSDGTLNLEFIHIEENPAVKGIEVLVAGPQTGQLGASPTSLEFGSVVTGESKTQSVTLTNFGGAGDPNIKVSGVSVSGDFSDDFGSSVTLAPGNTTSFDVTFSPDSAGSQSAQLEITHNAPNTPSPIVIDLSGEGVTDAVPTEPAFGTSTLSGASPIAPTSLQFGPDGRLYVSGRFGEIYIYTVERDGANDYQVTATETLQQVKNIKNHDDDGSLNTNNNSRQVTGLYIAGTADSPVLYVSSSDPRVGAGGGGQDKNLDTNSGVISRLTKTNSGWDHVQLVRGLPRSEENHATNGMQLDTVNNTLYVAQGGHANAGAPSNNFAFTTEYALSAAVLSVDLDAIDDLSTKTDSEGQKYKYNLPTLDDPTRSNSGGEDVNDPFGGNDGLNQAKLVPGGPVQIYAPGFRNLYDIVITQNGRMYGVDNGANSSWGGFPEYEESFDCTNNYLSGEPGSTGPGPNPSNYPSGITLLPGSDGQVDGKVNNKNGLHFIRPLNGEPYYGGHPTPIRGNPAGAGLWFNGTWYEPGNGNLPEDWPPVPEGYANPTECDFQNSGVDDTSIANYGPSTNGVTEYTASNFGGAMQGDILSVGYTGSGVIFRAILNAAGDEVETCTDILPSNCNVKLAEGFGKNTLDIAAQGDDGIFGGTIWVANIGGGISVLEPVDYDGSGTGGGSGGGTIAPNCQTIAAQNPNGDEDNDGYSNSDEADNGTNPCNPASLPSDNDNDDLSDLNDADDDNDGIDDVNDPFALDADNGTSIDLDVELTFEGQQDGGYSGLGFTGWMTDGSTDYLEQFDPEFILAGGATGIFGVEKVTDGDAYQNVNDQENAFQFGVDVDDQSGVFTIESQINGPFFDGQTRQDFQSQGVQIGTGTQSDYLKLVLNGNSFQVLTETNNGTVANTYPVSGALNVSAIQLYLVVDPAAGTVQPQIALNDSNVQNLGSPVQLSGNLLDVVQGTYTVQGKASGLAVGVISTSTGPGPEFSANWQYFKVTKTPMSAANPAATFAVNEGSNNFNTSTYGANSFVLTNTGDVNIQEVVIDTTSALFPDLVFDPIGTGGDAVAKCLDVNSESGGDGNVGLTTSAPGGSSSSCTDGFSSPNSDGGWHVLTLTFDDFEPGESVGFSLDMDPTSTQGMNSPGANHSGSVAGLELTGSTVDVTFSNGAVKEGALFGDGSNSGAKTFFKPSNPSAPSLNASFSNKTTVSTASQTISVSGAPSGASVQLLQVEGGLFKQIGVPLVGLESFEAHHAVNVNYLSGSSNNVTLTNIEEPGGPELDPNNGTDYSVEDIGLNHFVALVQTGENEGVLTEVQVVRYEPNSAVTFDPVRINAGGAKYTDANGNVFEADSTSSPNYGVNGSKYAVGGAPKIANTNDDVLYRSERYGGKGSAPALGYTIPVPDGTYTVTLHFAEIFLGVSSSGACPCEGKRVFDVLAEGSAELSNYDIFATADIANGNPAGNGQLYALTETFDVNVTDGVLNLSFDPSADNAKVSALEVVQAP